MRFFFISFVLLLLVSLLYAVKINASSVRLDRDNVESNSRHHIYVMPKTKKSRQGTSKKPLQKKSNDKNTVPMGLSKQSQNTLKTILNTMSDHKSEDIVGTSFFRPFRRDVMDILFSLAIASFRTQCAYDSNDVSSSTNATSTNHNQNQSQQPTETSPIHTQDICEFLASQDTQVKNVIAMLACLLFPTVDQDQ